MSCSACSASRRLFRSALTLLLLTAIVTGTVLGIRWLYPMAYADTVTAYAEEYGFSPSLIFAIIHTESHFRPDALSHSDAKGLMQITDSTYQWALRRAGMPKGNPEDLYQPDVNIHYGVYILHLLDEQFESIETVLAAYNAGQGHVSDWLADPQYSQDGTSLDTIPYQETAEYIRRVLTAQKRYQQIYNIP